MKTSLNIPTQKSPPIVSYVFWDLHKIWTPFHTLNTFSKPGLEVNIAFVQVRLQLAAVAASTGIPKPEKSGAEKKRQLSLSTCSSRSRHGPQHCTEYKTTLCARHDAFQPLNLTCCTSADNPQSHRAVTIPTAWSRDKPNKQNRAQMDW